jgi:hypothetical protein
VIIGIAVAVVVVLGGVGAFFAFKGDGSSGSGGGGTSGSTTAFNVAGAKKVAQQYFDDIASGDSDSAADLLCKSARSSFSDNLDGPNSDFDYTFTDVTFVSSDDSASDTIKVVYDVSGYLTSDKSTTADVELTFEVVDENGPKLCGETGDAK